MHRLQEVIEKLIILFRELIELENIKLRAAAGKKPSGVEECITKEQAMILRLKGLDKEREQVQKDLGFEGLTFQEILVKVSIGDQDTFLPLFDELSRQIQMYQEVSRDTYRMLEVNIRAIQNEIEARNGSGGGVYTGGGMERKAETHMTNQKA